MAFLRSFTRSRSLFSAVQRLRSRPDSPSLGHISLLPETQRRSISFPSLFSSKIDSDSDKVDVGTAEEGHRARHELTDLEEESPVLQENREIEVSKNDDDDDDDSGNQSKVHSLHKAFVKAPSVRKPLSPEMAMLVTHLYEEGYFKDANFVNKKELDITCFEHNYAWNYIKRVAVQFGKDKQEVAELLPAEDLRKVALFGCPSVMKKGIQAAKILRHLFKIPEDTVCGKCALRHSCKFENKDMWSRFKVTELHLHHVMKIITLYALGPIPDGLVVPAEVKESVNRLLLEVVNLSKSRSAKHDSDDVGIQFTSN
ncbi:hypothetical protein DM860_000800 [Cuscuta australis]|uniref:Uncharacterized protein n=1 Tax=Cuscuta australis TaxID=267555 RepID=A0A328CY48_9ASTE|nr:hypothetical protein DM860_000800 [Cuscuta australis]